MLQRFDITFLIYRYAFSALTLLVGFRKSIWPVKGAGVIICLE